MIYKFAEKIHQNVNLNGLSEVGPRRKWLLIIMWLLEIQLYSHHRPIAKILLRQIDPLIIVLLGHIILIKVLNLRKCYFTRFMTICCKEKLLKQFEAVENSKASLVAPVYFS